MSIDWETSAGQTQRWSSGLLLSVTGTAGLLTQRYRTRLASYLERNPDDSIDSFSVRAKDSSSLLWICLFGLRAADKTAALEQTMVFTLSGLEQTEAPLSYFKFVTTHLVEAVTLDLNKRDNPNTDIVDQAYEFRDPQAAHDIFFRTRAGIEELAYGVPASWQ